MDTETGIIGGIMTGDEEEMADDDEGGAERAGGGRGESAAIRLGN